MATQTHSMVFGMIAKAIKSAPVSAVTEKDGGRGAYDFSFDATYLVTLESGDKIRLWDAWDGDGVEGECYRRYVELVGRHNHLDDTPISARTTSFPAATYRRLKEIDDWAADNAEPVESVDD